MYKFTIPGTEAQCGCTVATLATYQARLFTLDTRKLHALVHAAFPSVQHRTLTLDS